MKTRNMTGLTAVLVSLLLVVDTLAAISTNSPCIRADVAVVEIESSSVSNLVMYGLSDGHITDSNSIELVTMMTANGMSALEKMLNSIDIGATVLARTSSIIHYKRETVLTAGGNMIHYIDHEKDNPYKLKSVEGSVTRVTLTPVGEVRTQIDGAWIPMRVEVVRKELLEKGTPSEMHLLRIGPPLVNLQAKSVNISMYIGGTIVFQGKAASKEKDKQVFFFVTLTNVDEKNKE